MSKILPLLCSLGLSGLLTSCSQANSHGSDEYTLSVERPKTAAELRVELLDLERSAPGEYLHVEGKYWRNFVDQLVLEGDISSTATLARFKDPVLSVTWYSKTQTELDTKQYAVYEVVRPHGSTHFKFKTDAPDDVATVSISIADATPLN